jgi:histidyl-tRNA synthetase
MSAPKPESNDAKRQQNISQPPRGTRDFYPEDMRKRRWIEDSWRKIGVRHGFEEVDGPRFEHLDLYTVKSGEGIVSELFSFTRQGGETAFALRPEFTPTVARMVAARANALAKPIKWFSVGPYFRAERPQRGRLREFLQWNVDIFGDDSPRADAEVIACCIDLLRSLGFAPGDVRIRIGDRELIANYLLDRGVPSRNINGMLDLIDKADRVSGADFVKRARAFGMDEQFFADTPDTGDKPAMLGGVYKRLFDDLQTKQEEHSHVRLAKELRALGVAWDEWIVPDPQIVRGLAYYTGMVFEVHEAGGKERAIAGGGRYDGLIELFGGPPNPAVGFAMGDVVLSLVLADRGLMPDDNALRRATGQQIDVFVISSGAEESEERLLPTVGALRSAGLHARHSYKATRNTGKLVKEARSVGARFALFLEGPESARLENLVTGETAEMEIADIPAFVRGSQASQSA